MRDDMRELHVRIDELEKQLAYYLEFDALTKIYNKNTFYRKVEDLLQLVDYQNCELLCVDIEHFKLVNDIYGTEQGDAILVYLAQHLSTLPHGEPFCLGRIGADVFAILIDQKHGDKTAISYIEHIFQTYHHLDIDITPAIGIYKIIDSVTTVARMCDRATLALSSVKGMYMKHFAWYHDGMRNVLIEEQELLSGVEKALEQGEFEVYIQPKCNMNTGKITGGEALVRWSHPTKGMIPPKDFIPIFEKNGFIKKLDRYIWEETAKWLHTWSLTHTTVLPISVNISRIDVLGLDVYQIFQNLVSTYSLDENLLQLEITESAYTKRSDDVIHVMNRLMKKGFTILMDDFGSGYSSLNILKDININVLKLDMRFLDKNDNRSKNILESIVQMAKWLDLQIIAEGVENKEQVDFLLKIGCTYAQGFYYYKPMPITAFESLLEQSDKVQMDDETLAFDPDNAMIKLRDLMHDDSVSERMLNSILGAVAIYAHDGSFVLLQKANAAYYRLRNTFEKTENVLSHIHPQDRLSFVGAIKRAKACGEEGLEITLRTVSENQDYCWLRIHLYFLSEKNGEQIVYASLANVSDYMNNLQALQLSQQSFRIAMEESNLTIFELDIATRIASYTQHSMEDFGLRDLVANAPEGFIEQGSVMKGYEDTFRSVYDRIYAGEDRASTIVQARMGNGDIVWNRITLIAIKDSNGTSQKAVGLVENISNEIELELKLKEQKKQMI